MADVILGRAGSTVLVDLDVCVKTGRGTRDRVTLRGHTTPAWVSILLLVSIIGFLIAGSMTSRRYRVTLPFAHAKHAHWARNKLLAFLVGLVGGGVVVAATTVGDDYLGFLLGLGATLFMGAVVIGASNAWKNHVGIHVSRDGDLVLTRAHPAFAEAVRTASTEPISRQR